MTVIERIETTEKEQLMGGERVMYDMKAKMKSMGSLSNLRQFLGLVLIFILAIFLSPKQHGTGSIIFLTSANLSDILRQVSEMGIIALGMTYVILTGGIDLSVGSVLALSATFVAKMLTQWQPGLPWHVEIALIILMALTLTTACGATMGLLISKLRVQPFIITLAGMIGLRGFARVLTDNANIDIGFGDDISSVFAKLISPKPVVIGTFIILAIITSVLLTRTVFGLRVKSIGDNAVASRYAGLPVSKTIVFTYAISGFLVGVAGILHSASSSAERACRAAREASSARLSAPASSASSPTCSASRVWT